MSANLVGVDRRRRIVEETLHLKEIDGRLRRKLRLRSLLPPQERLTGSVCSLVDSRQWSGSYHHWFLDCLPRLIAADHYSHRFGEPTRGSCQQSSIPGRRHPSTCWASLWSEGFATVP